MSWQQWTDIQKKKQSKKEQAKDHRSPKLKQLDKEIETLEDKSRTQQEEYDLEDKREQARKIREESMIFAIDMPLYFLRF